VAFTCDIPVKRIYILLLSITSVTTSARYSSVGIPIDKSSRPDGSSVCPTATVDHPEFVLRAGFVVRS
jgi:hypothetical protein